MNDLSFGATLAACLIGLVAIVFGEFIQGPTAGAPLRTEASAAQAPASAQARRLAAMAAPAPAR